MADYNVQVSWSGKDALSDSDAGKVISGDDFNTEFVAVKAAMDTKADIASETFTGIPLAPTAAEGTDTTQVATTAFVKDAIDTAILAVYPVGSIYCTVETTNPQTAFGGTWVAFGSGSVMVGQQSTAHDSTETGNDLDFNSREETGGSKTHTLTTDEMPAHTHTISYSDQTDVELHGSSETTIQEVDEGASTRTTSETGGGSAHNNLQPYIVVRFWKRTA